MLHRKGVARVAACAALACAGLVRAEANGSTTDQGLTLRPVYLQDATQPAATAPDTAPAPTPPKPLMGLLDAVGVGKPLEDANITLGGYVAGGYTISNQHDPGGFLAGRVFDTKNKRAVLDQLDFYADRPVDYGKAATDKKFDIGGHIDLIYGWDSGLIHSNGLFDNPATLGVTDGYYKARNHPENQFDINQAYLDFALPIGSGLRVRVGKFVTLLGWEVINPTGNALYSHSYEFGFAIPFTHTGVMGEYKLNDDFQIDAGITRGWNQSLNDNNGDPDFLGAITYTPQQSDTLKKFKFILNLSEGPQTTHDNHDWWTVVDFQTIFTASKELTLVADIDYGDAPHAVGGLVNGTAQWYAIAGYATYALNDYVSLNGRVEYYGDTKTFTIGIGGGQQNLYEATVGLGIKPFAADPIGSNLVIRPEVRIDYSDKRFFDAGVDHYQVTFGVDAYFTF